MRCPVLPARRLAGGRLARGRRRPADPAPPVVSRSAASGSPPSRRRCWPSSSAAASPSRSAGPRSWAASARRARAGPVDEDAIALLAQRVEETVRAKGAAEVPEPRRRPGDPRAAARARRGGLPAVRQRLPVVRLAGRLRARDRRRCAQARGREASGDGTPAQTSGRTAVAHQDRCMATGVTRARRAVPDSSDYEGAARHGRGRHRPQAGSAAARAARSARPGGCGSSGSGRPRASTRTTRSTWERRDVVMTNWRDGSINFEQRGRGVPRLLERQRGQHRDHQVLPRRGGHAAARVVAQAAHRPGGQDLPQGAARSTATSPARPTPRSSTTS